MASSRWGTSPFLRPSLDSDLAHARAIFARDRKAAAEFVQIHSDSLYRYIRSRLQPRFEFVDDIVQEIFLTAWNPSPSSVPISTRPSTKPALSKSRVKVCPRCLKVTGSACWRQQHLPFRHHHLPRPRTRVHDAKPTEHIGTEPEPLHEP